MNHSVKIMWRLTRENIINGLGKGCVWNCMRF